MSKPIIDAVRPAVWMLAALAATEASPASAPATEMAAEQGMTTAMTTATVAVDGRVAIGFFPPMSREQWDADTEGRFAQEMSDIEIALGDVKACVGDERLRTEMHTARLIRLDTGARTRMLLLGDAVRPAMGVMLVAPGRDPVVVFAESSAIELQDTAPQAAAVFFSAPQCRRPGP
jgi:hypothetical protein